VTDPPYGLSFMGKAWDYDVPGVDVWREVLRVLKPGGHLLAFAGTRTQHRMAVAIEDAGFEIRDMIAWVYGSGFPKSLDVSKAIDKAAGAEREAPATPEAQQWAGWGTALKPALEPITVARKPFKGTVAANVLQHGTGALNVDGCRVGSEDMSSQWDRTWNDNTGEMGSRYPQSGRVPGKKVPPGRWPANLIHDGSDEVVKLFPEQRNGGANVSDTRKAGASTSILSGTGLSEPTNAAYANDSGSAARFFYTTKATRAERQGVTHSTVKPLDLMAYLCRLVTPPGGTVLDPFMGSGTTIKAALSEGFNAIGIEREPAYFAMAEHRMNGAQLGLGLDA
jgi:hypothetical protein